MLQELLPPDAARRAEMQVWLTFTMQASVDPDLRALRDSAHATLGHLCRDVAESLGAPAPAQAGKRLHAFLDGLALHAVIVPDVVTPAQQRALLAAELDALEHRAGNAVSARDRQVVT